MLHQKKEKRILRTSMLRELSLEFYFRRKSEKDAEQRKFERCGEQVIIAASDNIMDGYTGHLRRLQYTFNILAFKIKVTAVIHITPTKCTCS